MALTCVTLETLVFEPADQSTASMCPLCLDAYFDLKALSKAHSCGD